MNPGPHTHKAPPPDDNIVLGGGSGGVRVSHMSDRARRLGLRVNNAYDAAVRYIVRRYSKILTAFASVVTVLYFMYLARQMLERNMASDQELLHRARSESAYTHLDYENEHYYVDLAPVVRAVTPLRVDSIADTPNVVFQPCKSVPTHEISRGLVILHDLPRARALTSSHNHVVVHLRDVLRSNEQLLSAQHASLPADQADDPLFVSPKLWNLTAVRMSDVDHRALADFNPCILSVLFPERGVLHMIDPNLVPRHIDRPPSRRQAFVRIEPSETSHFVFWSRTAELWNGITVSYLDDAALVKTEHIDDPDPTLAYSIQEGMTILQDDSLRQRMLRRL